MVRTVQYKRILEDEWLNISWDDIENEMIIRMFEPDGTPVPFLLGDKSEEIYEAFTLRNSYKMHKLWQVDIDRIPE